MRSSFIFYAKIKTNKLGFITCYSSIINLEYVGSWLGVVTWDFFEIVKDSFIASLDVLFLRRISVELYM